MDVGTAYGLPAPHFDEDLVRVGPGTPGGELLRRYWQPVARSSDATGLPKAIGVLGEDLVLYRSGNGRVGLMYPRCCHRGTTLLYGKVDEVGIRCCYHGWHFDHEGRCTDQPCEPDRGRHRDSVRQPWYPTQEYHGLVFAYLGPPSLEPVFPRYDIFENLGDDEEIVVVDHFAFGGPPSAPCNWFQTHENNMDPLHIPILHNAISGPQFNPDLASWPALSFAYTAGGVKAMADRTLSDGTNLHRITETRFPNVRIIPTPTLTVLGPTNNLSWAIPIDDTHTTVVALVRVRKGTPPQRSADFAGKTWFELDEEGHQRFPGDYEAQVGQGAITWHSEEHLVSSDRGVSMVRRQFREQLAVMAAGGQPIGVSFDPAEAVVTVEAGNYIV
jgi:phenylpropionate dioxygenase-like ring-hydroxylating dioxygenase large terminal subunit